MAVNNDLRPNLDAYRATYDNATQDGRRPEEARDVLGIAAPPPAGAAQEPGAWAEREGEGTTIRREVRRDSTEAHADRSAGFRRIGSDNEDEATKTTAGGRTIIDAGAGDDEIRVSRREGGGLRVTTNGESIDLTEAESRNLTIRGGSGNDRIRVDNDVDQAIRLEGGAGNDTIRGGRGDDTIIGGAGNDTIAGRRGHDYIDAGAGDDQVNGGEGHDVIYGLGGNDRISGGAGNDYLDGGRGNDTLRGGTGNDQVIGGRGDDRLDGGRGNDTVAGGEGTDRYDGGRGRDRIYHQSGERIDNRSSRDHHEEVDMSGAEPGSSVTVAGSAEFQERVESDLDALRSLPSGRGLLRDMDATGHSTTIRETSGGNATGYTNPADRLMTGGNTANGAGTDATVRYNPESTLRPGGHAWSRRPPIVGLYHEMVHAENAGRGSMPTGNTDGTKNRERIAVGLPIDEDGDASTPRTQPNRWTENGLRQELGLARRARY
jgi:Ca2+-binding RTX toxin-like protein